MYNGYSYRAFFSEHELCNHRTHPKPGINGTPDEA
jgi:hypothetical protein